MIHPIHYGYINGIIGDDNQEQDAYLMSVRVPVSQYPGQVIAIIHCIEDVEIKWVVALRDAIFLKRR